MSTEPSQRAPVPDEEAPDASMRGVRSMLVLAGVAIAAPAMSVLAAWAVGPGAPWLRGVFAWGIVGPLLGLALVAAARLWMGVTGRALTLGEVCAVRVFVVGALVNVPIWGFLALASRTGP